MILEMDIQQTPGVSAAKHKGLASAVYFARESGNDKKTNLFCF
jgi:hypothetical protein